MARQPALAVEWERYGPCPACGARPGSACFATNGTRQRAPHRDRPFTPDALLELLAENELERVRLREEVRQLREIVAGHGRALDLLLPQLTEDEVA